MRPLPPERTDIISREEAGTLPGLFARRVDRSPDAVAYCEHRDGVWKEQTWREMGQRVSCLGGAMAGSGLRPGDRVAVLLPNGTDWVAFDLAAAANGLITVPLYAHDSPESIAFVLADSGARLCLIDTAARWNTLAPFVDANAALERVWVREGLDGIPVSPHRHRRLSTLLGALAESRPDASALRCAPQDVATIVYTSGTTGRPKGVMLTHSAILWNAEANTKLIPPLPGDIFLSVLPLAHAFERTIGYYLPMMGGSRVVYTRSVEGLQEDLTTIRPTVLVAVPRLYERIYEAVRREAEASPLKRRIVALAASLGWELHEFRHGRGPAPGFVARGMLWPLLERLVARRVLAALGGRLRVPMSGGAALPTKVAQFFAGLGLPLIEGYGLTEAGPVVTSTAIEGSLPGSVGQPLYGLEVRLGEQSELIVRSPAVMQGYWQNEQATAQALSPDGWLRTGDIAEIRNGSVFITGRLKEILVLSTGEHVAPSAVEAAIQNDPLFEQACVIGDQRPCVVAILVLNREGWLRLARDLAIDPADLDVSVATDAILSRISAQTRGLPPIWQVRAILATTAPWTIADGSLTPTLKVKRRVIEARFKEQIDSLYRRVAEQRQSAASRRRG
ncbi:MAG: long-chain fatty acid--CoA ligase [Bradyrhizobium sp.]|uniref:AMP-dependent synthetase/ligase n=1 Tax=Bradyrhizobium sp. TaxID=376 RepID=UPI00121F0584|nr:long-chain fatty acid--CoA ligase [Bradyrhizobium sp.]THD45739.1 MAG: long-chain fatty acid--CoA ligase [Bradyrhizobium sp.]